jgi:hypothetical protein
MNTSAIGHGDGMNVGKQFGAEQSRTRRAKPLPAPNPALGRREAICASVKEAILLLSGLPPAHEIAGWFAGSDAASIISERLRPAAAWLADFNDAWEDD